MFVLEAPVISFNPKAFFCDELFRLCFPKLSLISTDPERATHSNACARPARSRYFLAQRSSKRKNSKPVCFFLWAASKAGTTLRFTDVELGLKPSQGSMCSLAGVEEVVAFAPKHSSVRNVGQDRRSAGSQPLKSSVDAHRILNSEHKCLPPTCMFLGREYIEIILATMPTYCQ